METLHTLTRADGATLAYRRRQCGAVGRPPLVLIHGAASNMSRWAEFAERTTLAATHDILRLDLRGHAQSLHRGVLSLEIWCDDIAAILDREGYGRAFLVGHCLGANVAALFAARYPGRTAGLVMVEPMLRRALIGRLQWLRHLAGPLRGVVALIRFCNRLGIYRRHLEALDLRALDQECRARLSRPGGAEALVRRYASPWQDLKTLPSANFLQDLLEVIRPLPLEHITTPFLALLSSGRTFVDPALTAALLARLPGGELHTLEAKHWIPTEQPSVMRSLIETWVLSQEGEKNTAANNAP